MRSIYSTAAVAALLLGACGGSAKYTQPIDKGTTYDGGLWPDQSVLPDTAKVPGTMTCAQLLECVKVCTERACIDDCLAKGTTEAQAQFLAIDDCLQAALVGACKDICVSDPKAEACVACTTLQCKVEADACLRVGPGTADFGDVCDLATPQCKEGLLCLGVNGGSPGKGICTRTCLNKGGPCADPPAETEAACVLSGSSGTTYFCGFLCAAGGETFKCPSTLTCATADSPPDSGQRACLP